MYTYRSHKYSEFHTNEGIEMEFFEVCQDRSGHFNSQLAARMLLIEVVNKMPDDRKYIHREDILKFLYNEDGVTLSSEQQASTEKAVFRMLARVTTEGNALKLGKNIWDITGFYWISTKDNLQATVRAMGNSMPDSLKINLNERLHASVENLEKWQEKYL